VSRSSNQPRSVPEQKQLPERDAKNDMCAVELLVTNFTKILPGWLRRCGVRESDVADAAQEALMAALVKLREHPGDVPMDEVGARHELMRIVSNVARRVRRQAVRDNERYVNIENVEMSSARDEEVWIEARVTVLMAFENLDEPTRALIFAHEIEGQTNAEIAAKLKQKEDAVEKRVFFAKQRLRAEVEKLEKRRKRSVGRVNHDGAVLFGLGFDLFDRAMFGALYEVLDKRPLLHLLPAKPTKTSFARPTFPTSVLVGVLAVAPGSSSVDHETTLPQESRISTAGVSPVEPSTAVLIEDLPSPSPMPFAVLVQGCASRAPAQPKKVEAPVQLMRQHEEPPEDYFRKQKEREEMTKDWGDTELPGPNDP
jgi:RNA polymerase sigma factor (sigma-70 family)